MATVDTREALSASELAAYRRDGFVVPEFRLAGAELALLQAETMAVVEANPQLRNRPIPNPNCVSFRRHGIRTDGGLMRFAAQRGIVDIVERIMGPDIILWSSTIFNKPPVMGKRTPWHRDGEFWPIEPLAATSVWIAVTPSTITNGCLRVIPGSHLSTSVGRHYDLQEDDVIFPREIAPDEFDAADAVDVELEPGQMVFFDARIIHGANANDSADLRTGFSARYMPGSSFFNHGAARVREGDEDGFTLQVRPLFLLRGQDHANNDFTRNAAEEDRQLLRTVPGIGH